MNTPTEPLAELELLAKRLYVAKSEQRSVDMQTYGANIYAPISLEDCRIELGLPPNSESEQHNE